MTNDLVHGFSRGLASMTPHTEPAVRAPGRGDRPPRAVIYGAGNADDLWPMCAKCNKRVEQFYRDPMDAMGDIPVRVCCHGETQEMIISRHYRPGDGVIQGRGLAFADTLLEAPAPAPGPAIAPPAPDVVSKRKNYGPIRR
ncbi:MAG: hypothetical protein WDN04_13640 [Rhodospirillales bacterium]